ncbi:acetylglutamate kinase [Nanchangia anserum]|uniref:Acetylglutamate kinase n=1 Tax=Nanchangia anserum TaxID=2692125 RepID=A0A8I0GF91_9ACTO|nr:acetylglutamate kinase [Nanchangia anserum]MBD3688954.1 acetylglutamate kinase [Nanchangia anserum]QOX81214.1 acetylglutamate kinase [Nanchangia anserum]
MNTIDIPAHVKASVLLETMPWLRMYSGQRIVIKYGGHAMTSPALQESFAEDIRFLHQWGVHPIVVHGGGPQINAMVKRLDLDAPFTQGLRVTTPEVMDVVRMVLTGSVQRELVSLINRESIWAVGISGEDGGLLQARKTMAEVDGRKVDIGQVGEISAVDPSPIEDLLAAGRIPIISTVALNADHTGGVLNVNADTAAAAVAAAVGAKSLIVLTDVDSLYRDWPECKQPIERIGLTDARAMLPSLDAGMRPKLGACIDAVAAGVRQATIIDGRQPHSMMLEIFTNKGVGTMVVTDDRAQGDSDE